MQYKKNENVTKMSFKERSSCDHLEALNRIQHVHKRKTF